VRQWYVAYPKGKQLSVIAQAFRDFLHSSSASHMQLDCAHAVAGHCPFLTQADTGLAAKAGDGA
jgi:LysR family transcriptional regulator, low CO2-responsive transcriptional regulator